MKAIKPKVHIFGHIHEQRGHCQQFGIEFYNVSSATTHYELIEEPTEITFEKDVSEVEKEQEAPATA